EEEEEEEEEEEDDGNGGEEHEDDNDHENDDDEEENESYTEISEVRDQFEPSNRSDRSLLTNSTFNQSQKIIRHVRAKTNVASLSAMSISHHHTRTKSQTSLTEMGNMSPPKGPDLTLVCTRIESRDVLKKELSEEQYLLLLNIHNDVIEKCVKKWNGYIVEKPSSHMNLYDYFLVFGEVYKATQCCVTIQEMLYSSQWPQYLFDLEQQGKLHYYGTPRVYAYAYLICSMPSESFRGLRVGICLHTGRLGGDRNPFDEQKESLSMEEKMVFDMEYSGTCVDLCKQMCHLVCGGELLGTGATKAALTQARQTNLNISSLQILGYHHFDHLRTVKLLRFVPNGQQKIFPLKHLNGGQQQQQQSPITLVLLPGCCMCVYQYLFHHYSYFIITLDYYTHYYYYLINGNNSNSNPPSKTRTSVKEDEDNLLPIKEKEKNGHDHEKEKRSSDDYSIEQPKASHRHKQMELEIKRQSQLTREQNSLQDESPQYANSLQSSPHDVEENKLFHTNGQQQQHVNLHFDDHLHVSLFVRLD
ncbi:hypothetical protein RFI_08733, partial [Reticulomyxa filosa]